MFHRSLLLTCAATVLFAADVPAASIQLTPSKDNTLIQRTDPNAQYSNGLGDIFCGRTNQDGQGEATISIRRGLMAFDIAGSIPAGAAITGATLTMVDVMGNNGDRTVELHRVLQDWGEGTSYQGGGQGAPATEGDATWLYTFYDYDDPASSPTWNSPGGDFVSAASTSQVVLGGVSGQTFVWSSAGNPEMVSDLQMWLDSPADNFGWLVFGDESQGQTAKRLTGRHSSTNAPLLEIEYELQSVPEPGSILMLAVGGVVLGVWRKAACRRS